MEYKLKVTDELKWINNILEVKNTDDVLVLIVDFTPKYLEFFNTTISGQGERWDGFDFMKDEDTICAEGEQQGSVYIETENETYKYADFGKYSVTLVFVKDFSNNKTKCVYSK